MGCELYKEKCEGSIDDYCAAVAKKCKAGDKKSCDLYKKKCGKVDTSAVDKYCDALAKKCKDGNKKACDLYEKMQENVSVLETKKKTPKNEPSNCSLTT